MNESVWCVCCGGQMDVAGIFGVPFRRHNPIYSNPNSFPIPPAHEGYELYPAQSGLWSSLLLFSLSCSQ